MVFRKRDNDGSGGKRRRRWMGLLLVAAALGVGVYLLHRSNVDVRGAFHLARTASAEAATTAKVKAALALSSKVSAFDIDVETQGGVVRLRGEVPSDEIRKLAVAIAEDTSGVIRVEDQLLVDPSARPSPELAELRNRVRDLEIQTAIESALRRNSELRDEAVSVLVENQRVTLSGAVTDPANKYGAERIAASIEGVSGIDSSIDVLAPEASESVPEDSRTEAAEVEKRVEFELFASGAFDLERLQVRATEGGAVTLSGEVRSHAEKLLAERIAREVEGVEEVVNELEALAIPRQAEIDRLIQQSTSDVKDTGEHDE